MLPTWLLEILGYKHIFPCIILVLYFCSTVRYAYEQEWGRVLYWFAAGLITIAATFLIKH